MSNDIRPGDVVVCVDAKHRAGAPEWQRVDVLKLQEGAHYRIVGHSICPVTGEPSLHIRGVVSGSWSGGWRAYRFRKLPKADEQFAQQVRACRPIKRKEPVSC